MAVKRKLRKATCRICGVTFRRATGADIIRAVGKHYHAKHADAMKRKIKRGMKKASNFRFENNPISGLTVSKYLGFIVPPAGIPFAVEQYKGFSAVERRAAKVVTRAAVLALGAPEATPLVAAIFAALDRAAGVEPSLV